MLVKTETPFDPDAELIVINATIRGPRGSTIVRMAIDTGSAATLIVPDVFELANRYGIEGLVGLNYLERFNYEIRSAEGRILVEKIG